MDLEDGVLLARAVVSAASLQDARLQAKANCEKARLRYQQLRDEGEPSIDQEGDVEASVTPLEGYLSTLKANWDSISNFVDEDEDQDDPFLDNDQGG
jgi:hypothetical protein